MDKITRNIRDREQPTRNHLHILMHDFEVLENIDNRIINYG